MSLFEKSEHFRKGEILICKENNFNHGVSEIPSYAQLTIGKSYVALSDTFKFLTVSFIRISDDDDSRKDYEIELFYTKQEMRDLRLKEILK